MDMNDSKKNSIANVSGADVERFIKEWKTDNDFVKNNTKDFSALDTIANAQYAGPKTAGKAMVGDTTIAGIVRQMMRAAVKKVPNVFVSVNGSRNTVEAIICRSIVERHLLNPLTFGRGLVGKLQLGGRAALTRGFAAFQVSAISAYGRFGFIPKLIHYNDIGIEPGVQDSSLSGRFEIRTKWTKSKLDSVIKRESRKAKGQSTYNIAALKELREMGPDGSGSADYQDSVSETQKSAMIDAQAPTYDIITRYSSDPDEPIVAFSPRLPKPLRVMENFSKLNYPRVLFMVIDPAELSPFGDSRVRLASPNQNLLMVLRQNVSTTWMYNSHPAVQKMGTFTGPVSLKAGTVIESTDPNARVSLLNLDTTTAQQYPTISQEITKQVQSMMGMNPGQALGAIGGAKTGVGAQAQKQGMDDSVQQITTIVEEFLCQYVVSALDLYLSERSVTGEGILYVDDTTKQDILRIRPDAFPDENNPNALTVEWASLYDKIEELDVTVDATMSKEEWSDEKRSDLQDAVTVMSQTADPNDPQAMAKKKVVEDKLIDEIAPELSSALDHVDRNGPQLQSNEL